MSNCNERFRTLRLVSLSFSIDEKETKNLGCRKLWKQLTGRSLYFRSHSDIKERFELHEKFIWLD